MTSADSPTKSLSAAFWLLATLLAVLTALPQAQNGYSWIDAAETIYHARQLAHGEVPYLNFFTHHFVGYVLPFAAIERLMPISPFGFWLLSIGYQIGTAIGLYWIGKFFGGLRGGRLAALLAISLGFLPGWAGALFLVQSNIEPLIAIYLATCLWALRRWNPSLQWLLGIVAGVLLTQDQRMIILLPLLMFPFIKHGWFPLPLARVIAGCAFVPLVALLVLAANQALPAFVFQTFIFPTQFRNSGVATSLWSVAYSLCSQAFYTEPLFLLLAFFGAGVFFSGPAEKLEKVFILSALVLGLWTTLAGGREFIHYLLFAAPILIFLASAPASSLSALRPAIARGWLVVAFVSCLLAALAPIIRQFSFGTPWVHIQNTTIDQLAQLVRGQDPQDHDLLVLGYAPQIYLKTDTFSPFPDLSLLSVFGANFESNRREDQGIVAEMEDKFRSMLQQSPPRLLVTYAVRATEVLRLERYTGMWQMPTAPFPQADLSLNPHLKYIQEIIDARYELIGQVDNRVDYGRVYRIR